MTTPTDRYEAKAREKNREKLDWAHGQLRAFFESLPMDFRGELSVKFPILRGMAGDPSMGTVKYMPREE